mmetsp:Transcript_44148/g.141519  ORF Transcript_44148/g.141519 Transcript_44148/m.141519 type:complete len:457 (-) Transcript_44148:77-1447(-)
MDCGTVNQPAQWLSSNFRDLEGLSSDLCCTLLFDDTTSDVALQVQDARMPAHRAILAARSPVFKAMFFGPMLESGAAEVQVSTFSAQTMRLLLRFIYSGSVEDVNLEDMVPLMACADHYGVSTLRDRILNHLQDSISPETACTVLALARTYQQEHIQERYLSFILMHAQQVLRTEGFLNLDVAVLTKVLEADDARIEEIDIFKALVRWHRHWEKEPEGGPDEIQAQALFRSIRYGQMTGQQLVTEVKPLAGELVPQDLYIFALEQVAAPGHLDCKEDYRTQSVRRHPPIGRIQASDASYLSVQSTTVRKVGPMGWNCTAVIDPSTSRTCVKIEHLADMQNGIGVAVFDPERTARGGTNTGFPNPNQWGADCLVGIYGTGCFFGIITEHVLRWQPGMVLEVNLRASVEGSLHVCFTAEGAEREDDIQAEGHLAVSSGAKLAVALYSPDDKVSIESVW